MSGKVRTSERILNYFDTVQSDEYDQLSNGLLIKIKRKAGRALTHSPYLSIREAGHRITLVAPRPSHFFIQKVLEHASRQEITQKRVAKLLSNVLFPLANIPEVKPHDSITAKLVQSNAGFCSMAEPYFISSQKQAQRGTIREQRRLRVYHDAANTPIALEKAYEASNALLLQGMRVGKVELPAGTLVAFEHDNELTKTGENTGKSGNWTAESYLIENGVSIAPGRMTPWVYNDPLEQAIFGVDKHGEYRTIILGRADECQTPRTSFDAAAQQVLELAQRQT